VGIDQSMKKIASHDHQAALHGQQLLKKIG
jgi:hypothetical protein